ncbi:MAG: hypothetical protein Ct9H90mP16_16430 [Candidatus Poseidoniales archaeon]|nr:MAG: hypothetical protein Ct9H90mP16_16430 [Candidatus Poseidoniales archaeon]
MIEEGVGVFVIEVAFAKGPSFFLSIFNFLKAFLALGLAGGMRLAVVTIRNVSERQHPKFGILRALGFPSQMVVWTFLVELSWVFSWDSQWCTGWDWIPLCLYDRFLKEDGAAFIMPWTEILFCFGGLHPDSLATIWPSEKPHRFVLLRHSGCKLNYKSFALDIIYKCKFNTPKNNLGRPTL